jgi:hypothetical protein
VVNHETCAYIGAYINYESVSVRKEWTMVSDFKAPALDAHQEFSKGVEGLLNDFIRLWWQCPTTPTDLGQNYNLRRQLENEKRTDRALGVLDEAMLEPRQNGWDREDLLRKLVQTFYNYTWETFGFSYDQLEAVRTYGFEDMLMQFARMAREFDPALTMMDLYQAGRNLWSMNFVQLLLGLTVEVTPSLFAYSLLYPYTDNYLDDPDIDESAKHFFNQSLARRLAGESIEPRNEREQRIFTLVKMFEEQYERRDYPQVYESLLAIHKAQTRSLGLLRGDNSPYAVDILGISFEKGGTSVLADGYLVAGELTSLQREKMFAYGTLTQLVDDLEDAQSDRQAGLMTVFSQALGRWRLDEITNRTLHFGARVVKILANGAPSSLEPLMNLFADAVPLVIIQAAAGQRRYFSRDYVMDLQAHYPLRFVAMDSRRKRLYRKRLELSVLVDALIYPR